MKIVKPNFESLLDELDNIYLRLDIIKGKKSVIAGGLNKTGDWLEYPTELSNCADLNEITKCFELMTLMIELENKNWTIETDLHTLIREMDLCLN